MTAIAVTAIGFARPQQALASRHHHNNGIKVDQQISQANVCIGVNEEAGESPTLAEKESAEPAPAPTICLNNANNSADVHP
jgi:hypothetical protein